MDDVLELLAGRTRRLCELVDGTLVEKGMGYKESLLAVVIIRLLETFVEARNLGLVTGADGMMRLFADLVRIPDVAYVSWERIPGGRVPADPIPRLAPNLAVEVYSSAQQYRQRNGTQAPRVLSGRRRAGLDLRSRPAQRRCLLVAGHVHAAHGNRRHWTARLPVRPGLSIPLRQIFAVLDRRQDG